MTEEERLKRGRIANGIIDDLKEKTHDYSRARWILDAAVEIITARSHFEKGGGWGRGNDLQSNSGEW